MKVFYEKKNEHIHFDLVAAFNNAKPTDYIDLMDGNALHVGSFSDSASLIEKEMSVFLCNDCINETNYVMLVDEDGNADVYDMSYITFTNEEKQLIDKYLA